ncbi:MAG: DUF3796 domain-containing protein [Nanobdellota archaeon]
MMKKIRVLGLLGLLGFLGLFTGNYGFFGFFGFFSFFAAAKVSDERLTHNVYRSGFNSFVVSLIGLSLLITAHSMRQSMEVLAIITASVFVAMIIAFVLSMNIYERKGENI